ncbi:MAG TPA: hypothetical protein VLA77_00555 [Candidatus Saccharimonadales bacterium]|nr:hypothetical protein [Candidatus Saccharimonadales bacterium]
MTPSWGTPEPEEVRGLRTENSFLRGENERLSEENERLRLGHELMMRILNEVALDKNTDLMIASAFGVSFDLLKEAGQLDRMRSMDYRMRLVFLDLDKMKVHNAIGDHDGGDAALAIVGSVLNGLYRRAGDRLMPTPELNDTVEDIIDAQGTVSLVARYQKGDEFLAAMLQPPTDEYSSRIGTVEDQKTYLEEGFKGLYAKYPSTNPDYPDGEYELDGVKFKVENGIAIVPLSLTFGLVEAPVPRDRDELRKNVGVADAMMMDLKRKRTSVATSGSAISLLPKA